MTRNIVFGITLLAAAATGQWYETTVPADSYPSSLCHNTKNDYVYCGNWGGDNVTVIDGASNTIVATVPVGDQPHGVIYYPDSNRVFCLNEQDKTISVIDGASNTVVATESIGTWPWDGVLCPVNNRLYILGHGPYEVVVFDAAAGTVDTTIALPRSPYGICYDSTDNRVYVATRADSTVRAIDCATNAVIATIHVGPAPNKLCWNSRENRVYTATASGNDSTVAVIDCASNTVVASLKPGQWPARLTYDPVYSRVYVSCYGSNRVVIIDGATNNVVATVATTGSPEGGCAVPAHGYVFIAAGSDTVLVLNADDCSVVARVGLHGGSPDVLLYNPTDDRVYATNYYHASVAILRAHGTGIVEGPAAPRTRSLPTICRGVLRMGPRLTAGSRPELLDASGRKVLSLAPGANDVSRLAPGVYFVSERPTVRKVVIE